MIRSLNRAPKPAIPTEVVERIIDMVSETVYIFDDEELEERTDSLHACALVAWSWVPRSRIHLFRLVVLWSDRRTRRFLNSLTLSPALGQYAEILQMRPRNKDESTCGWIFKALSTLPPLLPHLRELAFHDLPDLRPECIAILSRFRTVESLEFYDLKKQSLRETVQLISRFPRLRQLHVRNCSWKMPGQCYSGKQHNLAMLDVDTDSYDCDESFLEWALASKSTGALTTFRARSDVAGSAMNRVLETCCSTLRELHLFFYDDDKVPLLTNHLKLQRLALHGFSEYIISVLARLPLFAPSSFVDIQIDLRDFNSMNDSEEVPKSEWKAADLALCDAKFPHLKSVQFNELFGEHLQNPHAFFRQALPTCYERGILCLRRGFTGPCMRIAPVDTPQYPGLPLEWEIFFYP